MVVTFFIVTGKISFVSCTPFMKTGTWEKVVPSTQMSRALKVRSYKVPQKGDEETSLQKWTMGGKISPIVIRFEEMCGHGVHFEDDSGMLRAIFSDGPTIVSNHPASKWKDVSAE